MHTTCKYEPDPDGQLGLGPEEKTRSKPASSTSRCLLRARTDSPRNLNLIKITLLPQNQDEPSMSVPRRRSNRMNALFWLTRH